MVRLMDACVAAWPAGIDTNLGLWGEHSSSAATQRPYEGGSITALELVYNLLGR